MCQIAQAKACERFDIAMVMQKQDGHQVCCPQHALALPGSRLAAVPLVEMRQVWSVTVHLDLVGNQLSELPADLFSSMPHLESLLVASNSINKLPSFRGAKALR